MASGNDPRLHLSIETHGSNDSRLHPSLETLAQTREDKPQSLSRRILNLLSQISPQNNREVLDYVSDEAGKPKGDVESGTENAVAGSDKRPPSFITESSVTRERDLEEHNHEGNDLVPPNILISKLYEVELLEFKKKHKTYAEVLEAKRANTVCTYMAADMHCGATSKDNHTCDEQQELSLLTGRCNREINVLVRCGARGPRGTHFCMQFAPVDASHPWNTDAKRCPLCKSCHTGACPHLALALHYKSWKRRNKGKPPVYITADHLQSIKGQRRTANVVKGLLPNEQVRPIRYADVHAGQLRNCGLTAQHLQQVQDFETACPTQGLVSKARDAQVGRCMLQAAHVHCGAIYPTEHICGQSPPLTDGIASRKCLEPVNDIPCLGSHAGQHSCAEFAPMSGGHAWNALRTFCIACKLIHKATLPCNMAAFLPAPKHIEWFSGNLYRGILYASIDQRKHVIYNQAIGVAPMQRSYDPERYPTFWHDPDSEWAKEITRFESTHPFVIDVLEARTANKICPFSALNMACGAAKGEKHFCMLSSYEYKKKISDRCMNQAIVPCGAHDFKGTQMARETCGLSPHYCGQLAPTDNLHPWNRINRCRCNGKGNEACTCLLSTKQSRLSHKRWLKDAQLTPPLFITDRQKNLRGIINHELMLEKMKNRPNSEVIKTFETLQKSFSWVHRRHHVLQEEPEPGNQPEGAENTEHLIPDKDNKRPRDLPDGLHNMLHVMEVYQFYKTHKTQEQVNEVRFSNSICTKQAVFLLCGACQWQDTEHICDQGWSVEFKRDGVCNQPVSDALCLAKGPFGLHTCAELAPSDRRHPWNGKISYLNEDDMIIPKPYSTWVRENKGKKLYADRHQEEYLETVQIPKQSAYPLLHSEIISFNVKRFEMTHPNQMGMAVYAKKAYWNWRTENNSLTKVLIARARNERCPFLAVNICCGAIKGNTHYCTEPDAPEANEPQNRPCRNLVYRVRCLAQGPDGIHYCAQLGTTDPLHPWNLSTPKCVSCRLVHQIFSPVVKCNQDWVPRTVASWTRKHAAAGVRALFITGRQRQWLRVLQEKRTVRSQLLRRRLITNPRINIPDEVNTWPEGPDDEVFLLPSPPSYRTAMCVDEIDNSDARFREDLKGFREKDTTDMKVNSPQVQTDPPNPQVVKAEPRVQIQRPASLAGLYPAVIINNPRDIPHTNIDEARPIAKIEAQVETDEDGYCVPLSTGKRELIPVGIEKKGYFVISSEPGEEGYYVVPPKIKRDYQTIPLEPGEKGYYVVPPKEIESDEGYDVIPLEKLYIGNGPQHNQTKREKRGKNRKILRREERKTNGRESRRAFRRNIPTAWEKQGCYPTRRKMQANNNYRLAMNRTNSYELGMRLINQNMQEIRAMKDRLLQNANCPGYGYQLRPVQVPFSSEPEYQNYLNDGPWLQSRHYVNTGPWMSNPRYDHRKRDTKYRNQSRAAKADAYDPADLLYNIV